MPVKPRKPKSDRPGKSIQSARARDYAAATASKLTDHELYALDSVSLALHYGRKLLTHHDPDIVLTAVGRTVRASEATIRIDDAIKLRKRIQLIERRLGIQPGEWMDAGDVAPEDAAQ